jgi:hypothetical protein
VEMHRRKTGRLECWRPDPATEIAMPQQRAMSASEHKPVITRPA